MEVRSDPIESAKSHFFNTSSWGAFCDVTLTLKQARQPDSGGWVKIVDYRCRQAFRHFMNLLNRDAMGASGEDNGTIVAPANQWSSPMPKLKDLSRSLITLEQDATLIAVIDYAAS